MWYQRQQCHTSNNSEGNGGSSGRDSLEAWWWTEIKRWLKIKTLLELENSKESKCVRTEEILLLSICWRKKTVAAGKVSLELRIEVCHQTSPLYNFSAVSPRKIKQ